MSYTLQIWESPVPASTQEAEQIFDQLSHKNSEQNQKFITLAKQLTRRYPCITQLTGDEEEGYQNGVWSEGPLDGVCDQPIYGLGIAIDHVAEVMPFVCKTANALGLTAYDQQTGDAYLPSGALLTIPDETIIRPSQRKSDDDERITSNEQATRIAQEYLSELMKKHGFKWVKKENRFFKYEKGFHHTLKVLGGRGGDCIWFLADVCVTKNVAFIYKNAPICFMDGAVHIVGLDIQLSELAQIYAGIASPFDDSYNRIDAKTVSNAKSAMDRMSHYLEAAYLPVIQRINNFQELDYFYQKPTTENFFMLGDWPFYRQLLVAYLAGNKNIDAIADRYRRDYAATNPAALPELERYVTLIKTEQLKT